MKKAFNKTMNFLFAGVGGQGVLLASDILSEIAHIAGLDVKKSDIHGMSQRGGSVISQVRIGEKVYSPIIREGEVDFLIAFEILEAIRCLNILSDNCRIIVNNQKIYPISTYNGKENKYPEDSFELIKKRYRNAEMIDGFAIAEKAGDSRCVNLVLLGWLSNYLPFEQNLWEAVIKRSVPPSSVEKNLHGFKLGRRFRL